MTPKEKVNKNHGGARKNAGRKKGVGMTYDIQKHCYNFMKEMLLDDAIKLKATKELSNTLEKESKLEDYFYIIKSDGFYKLGYSSDFKNRYKNYKTHMPNVNLIYLTKQENCFDIESIVHEKYKKHRLNNSEWFNISKKDVLSIINYCSLRYIQLTNLN